MNWSKATIVPILLAIFVFAFSISALWLGDDVFFTFSIADGSKITRLDQVIPSQIAHYRIMNGRIPAHFLCQLYLPFLGKGAFAISNALVYVALLLMMARLGDIKYDDWRKMAVLACLILLGFRTKFTPTCQIGFPWMFALVAGFLLVFKRFSNDNAKHLKAGHLVWAIPFSIIAGWSQEALVIGVSVALADYVLRQFKGVTIPQWTLLFSFAIGAALLCLSPASIGRAVEPHSSTDLIPPFLLSIGKLAYYLRVSYLMLIVMLYLRIRKKIPFKELFSNARFYWIVWLIMLLFNLAIGVFGNRQLFGMEFAAIMIIISSLCAFDSVKEDGNSPFQNAFLTVLTAFVVFVAIGNTRFLKHHWDVYHVIDSAYKASENGDVYYDFTSSDVTQRDTYPSDAFTWHALEEMRRSYGEESTFRVLPSVCTQLDDTHPTNYWENIAKGAIAIVLNKSSLPTSIIVKRSIFNKRLPDSSLDPSQAIFENEQYRVFVIYEKFPFLRHDEVVFL